MSTRFVDPEAPLEDRLRVMEAHARLNHLWSIHGVQALAALYGTPHGRTQLLGMDNSEVDRIIGGIRGFLTGLPDDWLSSWIRAGDEYDARVNDALERGKNRTAAGLGLIAAMCHHVGEMMVYSLGEIPRRYEAALKCVESYRRVAEHFDPPARRLDIPFGTHTLPGYLRVPRGEVAPCVIITGGANSVKEENHAIAEFMLARGLATLTFDGPGQGEYFATTHEPLRASSFVEAIKAVVEVLTKEASIRGDRIGVLGKATSGLLVIRAAADEPRLNAVVAHPGSFDWGPYFEQQFPFYPSQLELFTVLGARSIDEGLALIKSELVLGDALARVKAPLLVVNSLDDRAIPAREAELIRDGASAEVEIVLYPGRAHGGPASLSHPLEADWLAEKLGAS